MISNAAYIIPLPAHLRTYAIAEFSRISCSFMKLCLCQLPFTQHFREQSSTRNRPARCYAVHTQVQDLGRIFIISCRIRQKQWYNPRFVVGGTQVKHFLNEWTPSSSVRFKLTKGAAAKRYSFFPGTIRRRCHLYASMLSEGSCKHTWLQTCSYLLPVVFHRVMAHAISGYRAAK